MMHQGGTHGYVLLEVRQEGRWKAGGWGRWAALQRLLEAGMHVWAWRVSLAVKASTCNNIPPPSQLQNTAAVHKCMTGTSYCCLTLWPTTAYLTWLPAPPLFHTRLTQLQQTAASHSFCTQLLSTATVHSFFTQLLYTAVETAAHLLVWFQEP
jgi:hypothetical protein